jgi:hypothetical protein
MLPGRRLLWLPHVPRQNKCNLVALSLCVWSVLGCGCVAGHHRAGFLFLGSLDSGVDLRTLYLVTEMCA